MAQSSAPVLRIGTRGSPLALAQAGLARARLAAALGCDDAAIAIETIRTSGDIIEDRPLAEEGGKGLFAKEIEEALLAGRVDLAVHSAKDLPTILPEGLMIAACLEREDARDVFISNMETSIAALPRGARIGTTAPRRIALVRRMRPDLAIVPMRGNVETRLRKLDQGEADGIVLALAGLKRLGLDARATTVMSVQEFLPAAGQGAIAVETRANDKKINALVAKIDHADTSTALAAERAFLAVLDGTCTTPIAAHATIEGGIMQFRGLIARPDGSLAHETHVAGPRAHALTIGADAGQALKQRAGPGFFGDRSE